MRNDTIQLRWHNGVLQYRERLIKTEYNANRGAEKVSFWGEWIDVPNE